MPRSSGMGKSTRRAWFGSAAAMSMRAAWTASLGRSLASSLPQYLAGLGLLGTSGSGWLQRLAHATDRESSTATGPARRCVLLWMAGGPSQLDTFDPKPGHANGGPFRAIDTATLGIRVCEHLPKLAKLAQHLAIVRGMSTKEGDHGRGTQSMHTGRPPQGPIRYPAIGAVLGKELGESLAASGVPSYVSISPFRTFSPSAFESGFLGPRFAPLTVAPLDQPGSAGAADAAGFARLPVEDLAPPGDVPDRRFAAREALWGSLQQRFLGKHPSAGPQAQDTVYRNALRLMRHPVARAFALEEETASVREAYGKGRFGQGCLLARRLLERGVPFVEVALAGGENGLGWDTHANNFPAVQTLASELDAGWSRLLIELGERGLLESTTIVWMGEFGRTPKINTSAGRDHFPAAWTCVLSGGGVRGGTVHGATSEDGMEVRDGKTDVGDLLATVCAAVGLDPQSENVSPEGRPIKLAEGRVMDKLVQDFRVAAPEKME